MKVTISIETDSPKAAAELLAKIDGAVLVSGQAAAEAVTGRRGRKPKEGPAHSVEAGHAEVTEAEMEEPVEAEEDFNEFSEELEGGDEDEKINEAELSQVKKALNAYSAKNSKQKALKILFGFAKTSAEVKKSDHAKLLKALKV